MTPDPQLATEAGLRGDEKIIHEAQRRFQRCETWEATARKRWLEDVKFFNADSDNMYQWPSAVRDSRGFGTGDERPMLTINKTRQHCLQIINDARQNKTAIKVSPTGNGATFEAAQILEGVVRHIEYISDAQQARGTATRHQVQGGIGYTRIVTDYVGDDTLDQEIFIRRVKDPLAVYVDPDFSEADGSDMRFAFVFDDMPRDEFEQKYPSYKDQHITALGADGWIKDDCVRVAEYFRRVEVDDQLVIFTDQQGKEQTLQASKVPPSLKRAFNQAIDAPTTKRRALTTYKIEWFLIIGDKIAEKRDWPGKYVPIIRWPGEETVIDGQLDRKGHVRALKDPNRMYNYNASAQVEYGALQSKIPYIAPAKAIEGAETYWESANTQNHSVLTYNHRDDDGQEIPAPQRAEPPNVAPAFEIGMRNAENDMMLVSGQYQAVFGEPSNERSGVAIQTRQRQGENATYHYIDHQAMAVRFEGKIILDLIQYIYDTRRIKKIMGEDGTTSDVLIDPKAAQSYFKKQAEIGEAAEQVIVNPNIGRYEVQSDVGPAFATQRQDAFNAFTQIISQNKELTPLIGDLMFKVADFPLADEIAERLKRMVPPQALGDEDPQMMQMQQQVAAMHQIIAALGEKLQEQERDVKDKSAKDEVDRFKAITDRLAILLDKLPDPALLAEQEHEAAMLDAQTVSQMMVNQHASDIAPEPPTADA